MAIDEPSAPSLVSEWRGVTEIINKQHQGFYRANATTAIMAFVFIGTYFGILWTNNAPLDLHYVVFAVVALLILWPIAFLAGYFGLAAPIGGLMITGATENSNLTPRPNDVAFAMWPWAKRFSKPDWIQGMTAYDFEVGKLTVSPEGIGGIVAYPRQDIISVDATNPQVVEITKRNRIFGLPFGKGKIALHFVTSEDAAGFLSAIQK